MAQFKQLKETATHKRAHRRPRQPRKLDPRMTREDYRREAGLAPWPVDRLELTRDTLIEIRHALGVTGWCDCGDCVPAKITIPVKVR